MTDRQMIAYGLLILLGAALAAAAWWARYNSHSQIYARQQTKRRKTSAARSLALMSTPDGEDRP